MTPLTTPSPERAPWALVIREGLQTKHEFTTRQQAGQACGRNRERSVGKKMTPDYSVAGESTLGTLVIRGEP